MPIQEVQADGAPPPDPGIGGVGPYQPQKTNVQMMSETVFIDVPASPVDLLEPKQIKVNASFTMRNQGQVEEQMQVIFPLTRLDPYGSLEPSLYRVDLSSFVAKADGQSLSITTITTPPELSAYMDKENEIHGFNAEVQWAAFEVTFPVKQDVLLQVEYEMLNRDYGIAAQYGVIEGFTGIAYILETGAGWYGNILSADITLRLPYSLTEEIILKANPDYVISGSEMHWMLKDFEPTREDNLEVRVINVDVWQNILDLRSKVEQNPNDVDSWVKLADQYEQLSVFLGREGLLYYRLHHQFASQCLATRQKVVDLRPEWGDAHYKLAEILWFSNPKVEESFSGYGAVTSYIQPDDPSIQEVLHELDLAWSYGLSENIDSWDVEHFLRFVNAAIPELNLTVPTKATAVPTITLAPGIKRIDSNPTNTTFPTVEPTFASTVVPTPISTTTTLSLTSGKLISVTGGLLIIIGIIFYRWKSKSRSK